MSKDTLYTYYLVDTEGMPREFDLQVCENLTQVQDIIEALDIHLDDDTIPNARITVQGIGLTTKEFQDFLVTHELPGHIDPVLHPMISPEDIWDHIVHMHLLASEVQSRYQNVKSYGVKAMRYYTRIMLEYVDQPHNRVTPEFMLDRALAGIGNVDGAVREAVVNAMRMYKRNETIKLRRRVDELEQIVQRLEAEQKGRVA
jgi:hypothetical protein